VVHVVKEGSVSQPSRNALASWKNANDCTQVWGCEFLQLTRTYALPT
jgi:hypothetical protein